MGPCVNVTRKRFYISHDYFADEIREMASRFALCLAHQFATRPK